MFWIEKTYERGACNQTLDIKNFNRMKIPIPSLADQEKIINNIMELEEGKKDIIKGLESNYRMRMQYMESMIKCGNNLKINTVMRLGEVCHFQNGNALTSSNFIDGEYPVIGSGKSPIGYHDKYNMDANTIICATSGSAGLISKYDVPIWGSDCLSIKSKNIEILTEEYLYNYLLLIQNSIFKYAKGCGQVHMDAHTLSKFLIPIPTLAYQNNMKKIFNNFDELKKQLSNFLQENEEHIKTAFMNSMDDYGNPNGFNLDKILDDV